MNSIGMVVFLVLLIVMMWFSTRNNKKNQKEVTQFRDKLTAGDEVMTGSGLIATVVEIDAEKNTVVVDSEGVRTRWLLDALVKRPAILDVIPDIEAAESDADAELPAEPTVVAPAEDSEEPDVPSKSSESESKSAESEEPEGKQPAEVEVAEATQVAEKSTKKKAKSSESKPSRGKKKSEGEPEGTTSEEGAE